MAQRPVNLRLGLMLRQAHTRAAAAAAAALEPLGIGGRHFGALLLINRDGVTTARELIRETGSDKAGMARTIERLADRGLVKQTISSTDRRVVELVLTPDGEETLCEATRLASQNMAHLFVGFDSTEIAQLESLLARFIANADE
jgi:MarR family transcriptional regulator, lower aerobic nicotinate degradation pathway regulator